MAIKEVLVRIHQQHRDKLNITKDTVEEAMVLLGVEASGERVRVKWLNYEDVYFKGTDNYIRIIYNTKL